MSMFEGLKPLSEAQRGGYEPPALAHGHVVAFDQSFASTGWVSVLNTPHVHNGWPPSLHVLAAGNFSAGERVPKGGIEQDLRLAVGLYDQVLGVLAQHARGDTVVAHEMPAVGGKFHNNSSPFSAVAVRIASTMLAAGGGANPPVVMVNRQSWAKCVCGNAKATKAEAHKGMAAWAGGVPGWETLTNEARRDAMGIAVKVLADRA